MLERWRILAATAFVIATPAVASAASGYATNDVRMRAGPGIEYPIVTTIPGSAHVDIHGCLSEFDWCDVSWRRNRGWVSANYLNYYYNNRYVYLPNYVDEIDVPVVTFVLGSYWDEYYIGRSWYYRRAHWADVWRRHGRYGHQRHANSKQNPSAHHHGQPGKRLSGQQFRRQHQHENGPVSAHREFRGAPHRAHENRAHNGAHNNKTHHYGAVGHPRGSAISNHQVKHRPATHFATPREGGGHRFSSRHHHLQSGAAAAHAETTGQGRSDQNGDGGRRHR
jgi:uncharacterized protein YraI